MLAIGAIQMKKNVFQKIEKIVINTGIGRLVNQPSFEEKILPQLIKEMSLITGQKPINRPAKKSISGFKIRTGNIVGLKTTLRKKRMADFLQKLIAVVLPRVRDFRGIDFKNIDTAGNLTIGLKEHAVFPEINLELSKTNFGVEITIVPKMIKNREEAIALYQELEIPLKKTR